MSHLPIKDFPFHLEICRLLFLLENSCLFSKETPAANLCDARFLYGIIRELSIALGGPKPQVQHFARSAILDNRLFRRIAGSAYPEFCSFVRSASIGEFQIIDRCLLHLIRDAGLAVAKGALDHDVGSSAIDNQIRHKWAIRASHHRKSSIVADVFFRKFPDTPPLVYGMESYDWWFSHSHQRAEAPRAEAISRAHQTVWQTLSRSVTATDSKWEEFVNKMAGIIEASA